MLALEKEHRDGLNLQILKSQPPTIPGCSKAGNFPEMSLDFMESRNPLGMGFPNPNHSNRRIPTQNPPNFPKLLIFQRLLQHHRNTGSQIPFQRVSRSGIFLGMRQVGKGERAHRVIVQHELHGAELHQLPHTAVRAGGQGSSRIPGIPWKNTSRDRLGKWDCAWIITEVGNFRCVPRMVQIGEILAWGDALGENSRSGTPGIPGKPQDRLESACGCSTPKTF